VRSQTNGYSRVIWIFHAHLVISKGNGCQLCLIGWQRRGFRIAGAEQTRQPRRLKDSKVACVHTDFLFYSHHPHL
jgi:hypothetical protein